MLDRYLLKCNPKPCSLYDAIELRVNSDNRLLNGKLKDKKIELKFCISKNKPAHKFKTSRFSCEYN